MKHEMIDFAANLAVLTASAGVAIGLGYSWWFGVAVYIVAVNLIAKVSH